MPQPKLIILRAYPGCGKTTVGKQLELRGVGTFIDHNAILTFVAGISGDDDGIYDQIADLEKAICKKLLKQGRTVIVARGFSKLNAIATYEKIASDMNIDSYVMRLKVSRGELIKRVASPERKLDWNPTTTKDDIVQYMDNYPLQDHPTEIIVDNEKPLDSVVEEIVATVRS